MALRDPPKIAFAHQAKMERAPTMSMTLNGSMSDVAVLCHLDFTGPLMHKNHQSKGYRSLYFPMDLVDRERVINTLHNFWHPKALRVSILNTLAVIDRYGQQAALFYWRIDCLQLAVTARQSRECTTFAFVWIGYKSIAYRRALTLSAWL
jgi:hypothetical protein